MRTQLQGKVAPVTGAASGIGLASSQMIVAAGARVVLADCDEATLAFGCKQWGTTAIPQSVEVLDANACPGSAPRKIIRYTSAP